MQEYHNRVTIIGLPHARLEVVRETLANKQPMWEWVGITINQEAGRGRDSGKTVLDFYSRGFPVGLDELSATFPAVTLECELFDITAPLLHYVTMGAGAEIDGRTEEVNWEGEGSDNAGNGDALARALGGADPSAGGHPKATEMKVDDFIRRWEEEKAEHKKRAKSALMTLLTGHPGIAKVQVKFDGCCDSGQVESVAYLDGDQNERQVQDDELQAAIEDCLYAFLPDGWEINEGSFGTVEIDVATMTAHVVFNRRVEEVYTEEYDTE